MSSTLNLLMQGGWPMIPLAIASIAAVAIILERLSALQRSKVIHPGTLKLMDAFQRSADAEIMLAQCQRVPGAFARILEEVIKVRHLDHIQSIESMRAVGRTQVGRLEKGLTLLEIIASAAPLIGLLGTVLGMVTVFDAITTEGGLGNPQILSDGISKALITTIAGLSVAIPTLAGHSLLTKRVDELAIEMQDRATSFIVKIQGMQ